MKLRDCQRHEYISQNSPYYMVQWESEVEDEKLQAVEGRYVGQ